MLLRAYWDDVTLGKMSFPKGEAIEAPDNDRMVRAAIRGGLLQVIAPPLVRVKQNGEARSAPTPTPTPPPAPKPPTPPKPPAPTPTPPSSSNS